MIIQYLFSILELSRNTRDSGTDKLEKRLEDILKRELSSKANRLDDGRVDLENHQLTRNIMKGKDIKQKRIFQKFFPGYDAQANEWKEFIDNVRFFISHLMQKGYCHEESFEREGLQPIFCSLCQESKQR